MGNVQVKTKGGRVSYEIQDKVDRWLEAHKAMKEYEAEVRKLMKDIKPYMESRDLTVIRGTNGGGVARKPTKRAIVSADYTSYDAVDVRSLTTDPLIETAIVEVADKKKVEALAEIGVIPKEKLPEIKKLKDSFNFERVD